MATSAKHFRGLKERISQFMSQQLVQQQRGEKGLQAHWIFQIMSSAHSWVSCQSQEPAGNAVCIIVMNGFYHVS